MIEKKNVNNWTHFLHSGYMLLLIQPQMDQFLPLFFYLWKNVKEYMEDKEMEEEDDEKTVL